VSAAAGRWLPLAAVTLLAGAFAFLNRGEVVAVRIGVATFYRAPLTLVVFVAFLVGMLSMLALSLRQDLRTRRLLRQHGLLDTPSPTATPVPAPQPAPSRYDAPDPYSSEPRSRLSSDGPSPHDQQPI
jgi:uncharacterized integral membrane protein